MPTKYVKVDNNWKRITKMSVKDQDIWKSVKRKYIKKDNNWELVFEDIGAITYVYNYGYVCGGFVAGIGAVSTIDRFEFPFDNGSLTNVAMLTSARSDSAACNSSEAGYVFGGNIGGVGTTTTCDRFLFSLSMGHITDSGQLIHWNRNAGAVNCSLYGYVCGGGDGVNWRSYIQRITFPFEIGHNTTQVDNLSGTRREMANTNSSVHGYNFAGALSAGTDISSIDRFTFPLDSANNTYVTHLYKAIFSPRGFNSSTYSYVCGGYKSSTPTIEYSDISRFLHPFNGGATSMYSNISSSRYNSSANNSSHYGFVCGGKNMTTNISTVERMEFAMDSGGTSIIGDLTNNRVALCAVDSTDFVSLFV